MDIIEQAINIADEMNPQDTDGTWLEDLFVEVGPFIKEWDVETCFAWADWPEREDLFPRTTKQDVGIDAVAVRRSDGEYIAVQCKSRQLDEYGNGEDIGKSEIDKFATPSSGPAWAERWIVTNGSVPLSNNAQQALSMSDKPVKLVNITSDLRLQESAVVEDDCSHCAPNPDGEERKRTKSCMQNEAISECVRILREHERTDSGGLPKGQARGKLILPCGTGKTRISLRVVEQLTPPGELSVVLCPSIALVAQIRREYLQNAESDIRALAVCSDETAGYDPKKEGSRNTANDPTLDNSNVSASEVKGKVTTDPIEIADWIAKGRDTAQLSVIFGTYQSGSRVAEALRRSGQGVRVLIADEAHRTAGLKRKRKAKTTSLSEDEIRVRDFTLCHDNDAFPATYRVYQTATPRIYDTSRASNDRASDWIVRSMDDERVFGVELYRKSYLEAVNNGWLSDYRIIALGVNDSDSYQAANLLASNTQSTGRRRLTSTDFLRGLAFALAMGGAAQDRDERPVPIQSCIAFMNTVDKSKNMAQDLQTGAVRTWLQDWLRDNRKGRLAAWYSLEHLDATSNVTARENAKSRLAQADREQPHGIVNVGIFGEGTDSPSLNAVAFLEARKSPIDVIQAVGRAMRTAPGKEMGYIICPIVFPLHGDPEQWLSTAEPAEGWQELGQILLALRAHDSRIEDELQHLLQLYVPKTPPVLKTFVAIASDETKRIQYREHEGPPGEAQDAVERVLNGKSTLAREFSRIDATEPGDGPGVGTRLLHVAEDTDEKKSPLFAASPEASVAEIEPAQIIAGKRTEDGGIVLRLDSVARDKPEANGTPGAINIRKTKAKAQAMINKGTGVRLPERAKQPKKRRTQDEIAEQSALRLLELTGLGEHGNAITLNLLSRSGLVDNRVARDLNILKSSVEEAAEQLSSDELGSALDRHFGIHNLRQDDAKKQADGCMIAALLLMNAAMLHQRIAHGGWLNGVSDLETVKNDTNVVRRVWREWSTIRSYDFRPVVDPAIKVIEAVEDQGKLSGLERALRHIAAEAERIAETYADMGADHAGPLFNKVMGNQDSDGAYFTRPTAASLAARLTLDACGDVDWTEPDVWRKHKTVDLACGSGTLLAAMLTEMKRRATEQGATEDELDRLQRLAVEETIKGLDINSVSLQLAASQLTAGNRNVRYRQMGLHLMPYGPSPDNPVSVKAGTLELLSQKALFPHDTELEFTDNGVASRPVWDQADDADLEDAVDAVKDVRIVIMNPPFTNRSKVGEKFRALERDLLLDRIDAMAEMLVRGDSRLEGFVDKNTVAPPFVGLADRILPGDDSILTMVHPTIALSNPSGLQERLVLAERYHIHTIVTCHQPGQINLSQIVNINESIIIAKRHEGSKPPTRFINLDRFPANDEEVADFHESLSRRGGGTIDNGWGEVSEWPAERIAEGDWSAAIWRSPELAEAASQMANHAEMQGIEKGMNPKG